MRPCLKALPPLGSPRRQALIIAPTTRPRQVVEQCARVIGLLSRVRLDAVVARFLRELTESPEAGVPPRLRSDSSVARQELFQLCDGMKHVQLAADHSRQVLSEGRHRWTDRNLSRG